MVVKKKRRYAGKRNSALKISAVMCARNEEENIKKTLECLKAQSIRSQQVIVVNDGSTDKTGEIAKEMGCEVVNLPFHEESYVGRPELAEVINQGLKRVNECDYVLIVGADQILPGDYIEKVLAKMKQNPKLVVASGRVKDEPYSENVPRGGGRIVNFNFWKEVNNLQYPVGWGWEAWLLYKAMQLGYEVRCFRDIVSEAQRPTGLKVPEVKFWGKGMYALGYDWKYGLGKCVLTFFKSPRLGWSMFWGWFWHKDVQRLDVADWVNQWQKNLFWKRVKTIVKRGGRK